MNTKSAACIFIGGCVFAFIGRHFVRALHDAQTKPVVHDHKFYVGLVISNSKIKVGVIRDDFTVISKRIVQLYSKKPNTVLSMMISLVDEVIKMSGLTNSKIEAIGIGTPGYVDYHKGMIIEASHFPEWKHMEIANILYRHTHIPTYIDNDSTIYTLYEYIHDKKQKYKDFFVLSINTGIGGGYICNNKLIRGSRGGVGEIGHTIYKPNGYRCPCGQRGCIESYASIPALVSITKKKLDQLKAWRENPVQTSLKPLPYDRSSLESVKVLNADAIVQAAKEGDPLALDVFTITTTAIATCCINIYKAFDPEIIILNGSLARAGNILYNYINIFMDLYHSNQEVYSDIPVVEYKKSTYLSIYNRLIENNVFPVNNENKEALMNAPSDAMIRGKQWVVQGTSGEDNGIIGAAALAMKIL